MISAKFCQQTYLISSSAAFAKAPCASGKELEINVQPRRARTTLTCVSIALGSASQIALNRKKAPASRGFGLRRLVRSVSRRDGGTKAAEAIVQPKGDHVHILANPVAEERNATGREHACACEGAVVIPHPEVVVFNTDRPVRREAILPADAQGTAPARVACRVQTDPGEVVEDIKTIVGHGRTTLHVEQ